MRETQHRMSRRSIAHDYTRPGIYHVTVKAAAGEPFGRLQGSADTAQVVLSPAGIMVEHELLHAIPTRYPMVTIDTYVMMPDHIHFIAVVSAPIVSAAGRRMHLGQVVAGFKYGCNRRYWQLLGLPTNPPAEPAGTVSGGSAAAITVPGGSAAAITVSGGSAAGKKAPRSGYPTLFEHGYCDVMPLDEAQLQQQRQYIKDNPRSRMLRSLHRDRLQTRRGSVATALTVAALKGYLRRSCTATQTSDEALAALEARLLLMPAGSACGASLVVCDSYGDRGLLAAQQLLPVVCHRRDKSRFAEQKARCLEEAAAGAVLVSPRIAKGEQEIMDEAVSQGHPVVLIHDNGFPDRYHPSAERIDLCAQGRLLQVSPWRYLYRGKGEDITVAECKAMNCVAQALCRQKDGWWRLRDCETSSQQDYKN